MTRITDHDFPKAATEHQRRAQPRRTASHNDGIEYRFHDLLAAAAAHDGQENQRADNRDDDGTDAPEPAGEKAEHGEPQNAGRE